MIWGKTTESERRLSRAPVIIRTPTLYLNPNFRDTKSLEAMLTPKSHLSGLKAINETLLKSKPTLRKFRFSRVILFFFTVFLITVLVVSVLEKMERDAKEDNSSDPSDDSDSSDGGSDKDASLSSILISFLSITLFLTLGGILSMERFFDRRARRLEVEVEHLLMKHWGNENNVHQVICDFRCNSLFKQELVILVYFGDYKIREDVSIGINSNMLQLLENAKKVEPKYYQDSPLPVTNSSKNSTRKHGDGKHGGRKKDDKARRDPSSKDPSKSTSSRTNSKVSGMTSSGIISAVSCDDSNKEIGDTASRDSNDIDKPWWENIFSWIPRFGGKADRTSSDEKTYPKLSSSPRSLSFSRTSRMATPRDYYISPRTTRDSTSPRTPRSGMITRTPRGSEPTGTPKGLSNYSPRETRRKEDTDEMHERRPDG